MAWAPELPRVPARCRPVLVRHRRRAAGARSVGAPRLAPLPRPRDTLDRRERLGVPTQGRLATRRDLRPLLIRRPQSGRFVVGRTRSPSDRHRGSEATEGPASNERSGSGGAHRPDPLGQDDCGHQRHPRLGRPRRALLGEERPARSYTERRVITRRHPGLRSQRRHRPWRRVVEPAERGQDDERRRPSGSGRRRGGASHDERRAGRVLEPDGREPPRRTHVRRGQHGQADLRRRRALDRVHRHAHGRRAGRGGSYPARRSRPTATRPGRRPASSARSSSKVSGATTTAPSRRYTPPPARSSGHGSTRSSRRPRRLHGRPRLAALWTRTRSTSACRS